MQPELVECHLIADVHQTGPGEPMSPSTAVQKPKHL